MNDLTIEADLSCSTGGGGEGVAQRLIKSLALRGRKRGDKYRHLYRGTPIR